MIIVMTLMITIMITSLITLMIIVMTLMITLIAADYDQVRAYNEGAKLRMCGKAWESVLAKLGTAATVLLKVIRKPPAVTPRLFSRLF